MTKTPDHFVILNFGTHAGLYDRRGQCPVHPHGYHLRSGPIWRMKIWRMWYRWKKARDDHRRARFDSKKIFPPEEIP